MPAPRQRIVVGLSGGVDSAVSAWLLRQQGHEVVGIFMKNWEDDDDDAHCASNADFVDAAAVADVIGIEIEHVNFAAQYKDRVFAEFLREYQAGRTPNPDVLCNAEIKFKAFLDHAMRLGADRIATGHYARVRHDARTGRVALLKGVDAGKDQSYFLHRLQQDQLARTLFPLGALHKTEVRRIAAEIGLPNAKKKDSTGICFIGERPFREFLNRYIASAPGPIKDERGRVLGEHLGLSFYTIGQRQGLGIGGVRAKGAPRGGGEHAPWFVARKDLAHNTLWVVQGHDHAWLQYQSLHASDASWVSGQAPAAGALAAKARYRQADAECMLEPDPAAPAAFGLQFRQAQWAVTPGQSAVLYDGEICLGGGVIDAAQLVSLQPDRAAGPPLRSAVEVRASQRLAGAPAHGAAQQRTAAGGRQATRGRGWCAQNGMSSSMSSNPLDGLDAAAASAVAAGWRVAVRWGTAAWRPYDSPPPSWPPAGSPMPSRLPSICISLAMMSVAYFSTPSLSVYLRVFRRPSTYTERPFFSYCPTMSASLPKKVTRCHSVSSTMLPSLPL